MFAPQPVECHRQSLSRSPKPSCSCAPSCAGPCAWPPPHPSWLVLMPAPESRVLLPLSFIFLPLTCYLFALHLPFACCSCSFFLGSPQFFFIWKAFLGNFPFILLRFCPLFAVSLTPGVPTISCNCGSPNLSIARAYTRQSVICSVLPPLPNPLLGATSCHVIILN